MEQTLSSPPPERLRCWRLFFESALALGDVLDTELDQAVGIPVRKRAQQHSLGHAENRGAGADAQRDRRRGCECEYGALAQSAEGVQQVFEQHGFMTV